MNRKPLSKVIEIISGGTPKTDVLEYWENGTIGWLSVTDFNNDLRFVYSSEKKITKLGLENSNTKLLSKGDIIISARGTVGALAQLGTPMCFNQSCFGLRGKDGVIDTNYLYYYLKNYVANIKKRSQGSVFDTINLSTFDLMEIEFPEDLQVQQKIASVLSALDSKIELNNLINAELEAMAKTLYDYWFVQFDFPISAAQAASMGKPNLEGKPYKSSGGKMVWNEELKREIPEGWEVKDLYTIANYINGLACQKYRPINEVDEFLPVIKIREMNDGISSNTEKARLDIPEKYIIDDGDVLFSWSATLDVKIWTEGKGALNQHIFKVTSKEFPRYYYYYELLNYLQHFKMMADLRKTTMGHITIDHLKTSKVVIAEKSLVARLDEKITPLHEQIILNKKQNQQLASLRNWLLPMLMNGQVTVGGVYAQTEDAAEHLMAAEPIVTYGRKPKKN